MARVFVHHDRSGKILAVASVRVMPEGLTHPFQVDDEADGVIEVPADDPAFADSVDLVPQTHKVDVARGRLVAVRKRATAPRRRRRPPSR